MIGIIMKKLMSVCFMFCLAFAGHATEYQLGEHYTKVQTIEVDSPEVREYFSFYCPHCYRFEAMAKSIEKNLPEGARLVKNHVDFLPGASQKMQQALTKALITAQEMEVSEQLIAAIFKYIHVHRAVFTSVKDVRNIFIFSGVDGKAFDKIYHSETVQNQADEMRRKQEILASSGDIKSVPSIVVNGKYLIDAHDLDRNNFEEDYNNLVKFLLELP